MSAKVGRGSAISTYHTSAIRIRLSLVILTFGAIAVGMLVRSTWIQIIHDPKLESLAKKQFQSKILMKPRRGLITDRTGEPLAINLETSSLAGNPQHILKSASSMRLLAHALNLSYKDLAKKLDAKKSFMWIDRHMSDEHFERLKKVGIVQPTGEMPDGLWIVKEMKRVYPHGDLASSLIGSVNVDTEGLEGVELWKNSNLRGKGTSVDAFKDALGRPALMRSNTQAKMEDGGNVDLSIDASLQYSVEESLTEAIEKTHADSGIVAVMDARTGELLALAQGPAKRGVKKITAITDGYEPGSTMKPLVLAQALNHGIVKLHDSLFGHLGKFTLQKRTIGEAEVHEKYGWISTQKMIEVSSNIAAAELALKIGSDRFVSNLKDFGFGERTGLGFPGEISGWLPNSKGKSLQPLTLATMGFGQSIMVTPLQMLRAYAAIANGGYLVEPTLLKRKEGEKTKLAPLLKPFAIRDVTEALLSVTEGEKGTGHKAQLEGYRVAGKTGTAQVVDPHTRKYSTSRHIASFIGFPVGVKQPIAILTLLNNPRGVYYAGETAAPLFSKVLKQVVGRFSMPNTEKLEIPLVNTPETKPKPLAETSEEIQVAKSSAEITERSIESTKEVNLDHPIMPSVLGLTPQEAIRALKPFMPQVQIHGFGLIRKQTPESGAMISQQVRVSLYLEE